MQKLPTTLGPIAANTSDYEEADSSVAVCFSDPTITHLFSALLEARGVHTHVLQSLLDANPETRIITEPLKLEQLAPPYKNKCLVVGNKESLKTLPALTLSRPLTEEKIDTALAAFLS